MFLIIPLVLAIIFIILYFQFRSVTTSLMVFVGVAIAFSGAFILLWLYGQEWFFNFSVFGLLSRLNNNLCGFLLVSSKNSFQNERELNNLDSIFLLKFTKVSSKLRSNDKICVQFFCGINCKFGDLAADKFDEVSPRKKLHFAHIYAQVHERVHAHAHVHAHVHVKVRVHVYMCCCVCVICDDILCIL